MCFLPQASTSGNSPLNTTYTISLIVDSPPSPLIASSPIPETNDLVKVSISRKTDPPLCFILPSCSLSSSFLSSLLPSPLPSSSLLPLPLPPSCPPSCSPSSPPLLSLLPSPLLYFPLFSSPSPLLSSPLLSSPLLSSPLLSSPPPSSPPLLKVLKFTEDDVAHLVEATRQEERKKVSTVISSQPSLYSGTNI